MDINSLIEEMRADGTLRDAANQITTQFGSLNREYQMGELMPELVQSENTYKASTVYIRTQIARGMARHARIARQSSFAEGSYEIALADWGGGGNFDAQMHDALIDLTGRDFDFEDMPVLVDAVQNFGVIPLVERAELSRCECVTERVVHHTTENEVEELIPYPVYPGTVRNIAVPLTDPASDGIAELNGIKDYFAGSGQTWVRSKIASTVLNRLLGNAAVRQEIGGIVVVNASGQLATQQRRANLNLLNDYLNTNNMPPFEPYDLTYALGKERRFFLRRDAAVFFAETDLNSPLDPTDATSEILSNLVGRYIIGRPGSKGQPGRASNIIVRNQEPPFDGAAFAWGTEAPALLRPAAVASWLNA